MCDCCKVTFSFTFLCHFSSKNRITPIENNWTLLLVSGLSWWQHITYLSLLWYQKKKNSRHAYFVYPHHLNQCPRCKWCIIFCIRARFLAKAPVLRIQNQKCSPNSVVFVERKHGTKMQKTFCVYFYVVTLWICLMRFSFLASALLHFSPLFPCVFLL